VALALQLHESGYLITLAGPGGEYEKVDRFNYFPVELKLSKPPEGAPEAYSRFGKAGRLFWQHINRRTRKAETRISCDAEPLLKLGAELDPDLILIDVEEHLCILAALSLATPVALFSVFFNLWKRPRVPPLHSAVIPGHKLSGRKSLINLLWLRFRFWKWFFHLRDFVLQGGLDQRSLLKLFAEPVGVRLGDHVDYYQWLIPFVYKQLLTLVLNPKEMEFPLNEPAQTTYVGLMLCTGRSERPFLTLTGVPSARLCEILEAYRVGLPGCRLVYCSFGSFFRGDDTEFLERLARCFKDTDWDAIIALGDRLMPEKLGRLPDNVCCVAYADQLSILRVADCAVIHGGMTTAYECIDFGVPMVVYPFHVNDQLGTAARIQYYQLGLVGDRDADSSLEIKRRIRQVMEDEIISKNLQTMQHHIRRYSDSHHVAQAVGELFERNQ